MERNFHIGFDRYLTRIQRVAAWQALLPQGCMSRQIFSVDDSPFSILACDSQANRHIERRAANLIDLHHRIDGPVIHELLNTVDVETPDARPEDIRLHLRA